MYKYLFIEVAFFISGITLSGYAQDYTSPHLSRGADTAELYLNCHWYTDLTGITWMGLFHSVDNGKTLIPKRKDNIYEAYGPVFGDSMPGVVFQIPMKTVDTFGVSFNYGTSFEKKYFNGIYGETAGNKSGEIYIAGYGLYRSDDYGNTFTLQSNYDSIQIQEVGILPGELFAYHCSSLHGPLALAYSGDYGQTFSISYVYFPNVIPGFDECSISRGTEPGELYFIAWYTYASIYLFHSMDYGQTLSYQGPMPTNSTEDIIYYTAGKAPGSFYFVQQVFWDLHSHLYIYFSRDYGLTYEIYFHDLDSTYTGVPSTGQEITKLACYPNPVSDHLTISLTSQSPGKTMIYLRDMTGRIKFSTSLQTGQSEKTIDISALTPGMYLLELQNEGKVIGQRKVVIAR